MNTVLWVIAGLLTLLFLVSGIMKVVRTKEDLASAGLAWTADFSSGVVKAIGVLEVLAAVGLLLPPVTDIAPVLAPLAALGLVLLMIGAMITHVRRSEYPMVGVNLVLLLLAAVVAWGRFGPYAF
ncbi:DoxX family protein [Thermopolyspora sp. NPDC052614]|uniref:DoxX family protein n=1 Tax=Thermopolyspora sp. NPDC052614 TaxID=3155682 RepID=UPI0034373363